MGKPRFSLSFAFVFMTAISLWFGLVTYVHENRVTWNQLLWLPEIFFSLCLYLGFIYWWVKKATKAARMLVISFVVGVFLEFAALGLWLHCDWITPNPRSGMECVYPLSILSQQIIADVDHRSSITSFDRNISLWNCHLHIVLFCQAILAAEQVDKTVAERRHVIAWN